MWHRTKCILKLSPLEMSWYWHYTTKIKGNFCRHILEAHKGSPSVSELVSPLSAFTIFFSLALCSIRVNFYFNWFTCSTFMNYRHGTTRSCFTIHVYIINFSWSWLAAVDRFGACTCVIVLLGDMRFIFDNCFTCDGDAGWAWLCRIAKYGLSSVFAWPCLAAAHRFRFCTCVSLLPGDIDFILDGCFMPGGDMQDEPAFAA